MEEFKAGEVVQLKSGGPPMTIKEIGHFGVDYGALCQWFDGKGVKTELFSLPSIEKLADE